LRKPAEYTTEDLARAYIRAEDRGPEALAAFKAKLNAAADRYLYQGEPEAVAFFDLFADDPGGRENA